MNGINSYCMNLNDVVRFKIHQNLFSIRLQG